MARRCSLAAALVLAVVALLAPAEAKGSKGVRRNSALHGKPRKKGRRPPPRKKKRRAAGAVAVSNRSREDPTRWPIFEIGSLSIPEKAANNRHRRDVGACLLTL